MRKLSYVLAALAIVGIGAPTAASAGGFGVYVGGDHGYYGSMDTIAACIADGTIATIMATGRSSSDVTTGTTTEDAGE